MVLPFEKQLSLLSIVANLKSRTSLKLGKTVVMQNGMQTSFTLILKVWMVKSGELGVRRPVLPLNSKFLTSVDSLLPLNEMFEQPMVQRLKHLIP